MIRIGFEVNGVLRDTIGKFKQLYEHHMVGKYEFETIDKTFNIEFSGDTEEVVNIDENNDATPFEYKIKSDVTSLDLLEHFSFPTKDDLYSFMYEEYTMELFGHAPSTEMTTFNTFNDLYYELRDNYDIKVVSDEIGKSKPSTLFFLSKFGCLVEKVMFYSEITKTQMWDEVDILITANPQLITNKPDGKTIIKYNTDYNKDVSCDLEISTLSEVSVLLEKIKEVYV